MKTLFDLREITDEKLYKDIQNLYGESIKIIKLGEQSIKPCIGCWNCWLKTPGKCAINDQMTQSYTNYINSDTVILLIDTAQGFINHRAKAFLDRSIAHYIPYIKIVDNEMHHITRYDKYPDLVFYFDKVGLTNQEEQVIEDYLYRTAYQFESKAYCLDNNLHLQQLKPRKAKRNSIKLESIGPMDKLVIYNGSPRRAASNSLIILKEVVKKLCDRVEIRDLKERENWDIWTDSFTNDKHVMFFMPLYVHAMPSHVMEFFGKLKPSQGSISYFVQSGFSESSQSHYLEAYFEQLSLRLKRKYSGTAIKGGVEGLKYRPTVAQEKMMEPMVKTIIDLVNEGFFNPANIQQLSNPIKLSKGTLILFKIFSKIGLINFFWDRQLKDNNAYEKRFDRPYLIGNHSKF